MKKLFNVDMHISIVHDLKTLLPELGHEIDSCCLSNHTWVNNEAQGRLRGLGQHNWFHIDQHMCDTFYETHKDSLSPYDGFIHSYPPAFAALFEKFDKPIYTIACTRYEYPCGSGEHGSADRLAWLNEKLLSGSRSGQIKLIANNLYDKKYCEELCGGEWKHIPSICTYVHSLECTGESGAIVLWDRNKDGLRDQFTHPKIDKNFTVDRPYNRSGLKTLMGVVHIPYNISVMSSFEQYAMGVPMFVPSFNLLTEWKDAGRNVLSEVEFIQSLNAPVQDDWIKLADWYDGENMPHIQLYDSIDHLFHLLDTYDRAAITAQMRAFYPKKKERVLSLWKETLS